MLPMLNRNAISVRISEVLVIIILAFLLGLVRIFVGDGLGLMVVWKGEFTYRDTVVNLDKVLKMSRDEMAKEHPEVLGQLEEMFIIDPHDGLTRDELRKIREHRFHKRSQKADKLPSEILSARLVDRFK